MTFEIMISRLVELGFSEREAKLYIALLEKDEVSAGDLHRSTGLPRAKTYTILNRMVAKGYCSERKSGRQRHFKACRPGEILHAFQSEWSENHQRRITNAKSTLEMLDGRFAYQGSDSRDFIEVVLNRHQIMRRYLELTEETKSAVRGFNRPPFAATTIKNREEQFEAQKSAMARGVKMWSIHQINNPDLIPDYQESYDIIHKNDKMKWLESLPMKAFIFDDQYVMMALPTTMLQSSMDFTMVIIKDSGLAMFCIQSFETLWEKANDFDFTTKKS